MTVTSGPSRILTIRPFLLSDQCYIRMTEKPLASMLNGYWGRLYYSVHSVIDPLWIHKIVFFRSSLCWLWLLNRAAHMANHSLMMCWQKICPVCRCLHLSVRTWLKERRMSHSAGVNAISAHYSNAAFKHDLTWWLTGKSTPKVTDHPSDLLCIQWDESMWLSF